VEQRRTAGYGSWHSPITSDMVASGGVRLETQVVLEGDDLYWAESRPAEGGRSVIVRQQGQGRPVDVNPAPFNVRTRVHEYGGGAFLVNGSAVYFSNFSDQRLYVQQPGHTPEPLTPEGKLRYADGVFDSRRNRIICVCQDHTESELLPANSIVAIDVANGKVTSLVKGNDFYSSPRLSPDGSRLSWLTWNFPDMPWDSSELWLATLGPDGLVKGAEKVAGGTDDSICQPRFSPQGQLHFISERTGWWNLYRYSSGTIQALCPLEAEFGSPAWVFGISDYAFESENRIICRFLKSGTAFLAVLDAGTRRLEELDFPYTAIGAVQARSGEAVVLAGSATEPTSLFRIDMAKGARTLVRRSSEIEPDPGYLSVPREIEFPTENGRTSHALYYAPRNKDFVAYPRERPPLVIFSHGGPTSASTSSLSLAIQYWTSRGYAIADVNYGGSTGYGREYRQRLDGQWGIVDVDDCVNCARYLIGQGMADAGRVAIRGGSAGGYTTLAALAFRNVFRAGASYYGVSDLEGLETDTHKFESRYLERLIGPYPERRDLFIDRSPIHHVDGLSCPVIFFQGDEDRIVPPNQAELMVNALRQKGLPVAYLLFKGEQHGFRQARNIKRALEAEHYFYSRIFGFKPADDIEPVPIENA
jgi:dipeptidyl aminopeptidase/acylaminoacyl peptidase